MSDQQIVFTPKLRDQLQVAYDEAVEEGLDSFIFEHEGVELEFVVGYAKYLLQYLDMRLQTVH